MKNSADTRGPGGPSPTRSSVPMIGIGDSQQIDSHGAVGTARLYRIQNWGGDYFSVNEGGEVVCRLSASSATGISLRALVAELAKRGISTPVNLRFPQIIGRQLELLTDAFGAAIEEFGYTQKYVPVYPIKVNQKKRVVEDVLSFGRMYDVGVEVGSKAELVIALALCQNKASPVVCNGVKDQDYLRLALLAKHIGKRVFVVLESLTELKQLVVLSQRLNVSPLVGLRLKLSARGSGKWEESSGDLSKFGFTTTDLLKGVRLLQDAKLMDCLRLLHFHVGSQVTEIRRVKYAVKEAARTYAKLRQMCPSLDCLDVGGGLGIDYDGTQTASESSVNYTVQEYANDIIYSVKEICESEGVDQPTVLTETGRMIVAPHTILVFDAIDEIALGNGPVLLDDLENRPEIIQEMYDIYLGTNEKNYSEYYHDILEQREEMFSLFNLGFLSLEDRGLGQELYWATCDRALGCAKATKHLPEEFEDLERRLAHKFICNFSVFQSIPDSWALGQLFPIMPIHRLNESAGRRGYLADLTCDSDGKVDRFVGMGNIKESLELHSLDGQPYYIGVFLTGAYQDVMGDYHNLFGHVHDVDIIVNDDGVACVDNVVAGQTVTDVLSVFHYGREELLAQFRALLRQAGDNDPRMRELEEEIISEYEAVLESYTYLVRQQ